MKFAERMGALFRRNNQDERPWWRCVCKYCGFSAIGPAGSDDRPFYGHPTCPRCRSREWHWSRCHPDGEDEEQKQPDLNALRRKHRWR